jgi:hypothetical protein
MDVHHGGEDTLLESQPGQVRDPCQSSVRVFPVQVSDRYCEISIVFLLRIQVQDRAGYKTDFKLDLRIG